MPRNGAGTVNRAEDHAHNDWAGGRAELEGCPARKRHGNEADRKSQREAAKGCHRVQLGGGLDGVAEVCRNGRRVARHHHEFHRVAQLKVSIRVHEELAVSAANLGNTRLEVLEQGDIGNLAPGQVAVGKLDSAHGDARISEGVARDPGSHELNDLVLGGLGDEKRDHVAFLQILVRPSNQGVGLAADSRNTDERPEFFFQLHAGGGVLNPHSDIAQNRVIGVDEVVTCLPFAVNRERDQHNRHRDADRVTN